MRDVNPSLQPIRGFHRLETKHIPSIFDRQIGVKPSCVLAERGHHARAVDNVYIDLLRISRDRPQLVEIAGNIHAKDDVVDAFLYRGDGEYLGPLEDVASGDRTAPTVFLAERIP